MHRHSSRANPRAQFAGERAMVLADQQRIRLNLHLPPADVLADETCRLLSASARSAPGLDGGAVNLRARRH